MQTVGTISDLLKTILEFKSFFSAQQIYYRGQKNGRKEGWDLLPSFYRERKQNPKIPFYTDKKEEINAIYKFVEKNYDYFKEIDFSDLISIINILQHYGFPTRVLDVTQNPLVALYFALEQVENDDENHPVIYLLYAEKVNAAYMVNNELHDFYNENIEDKKRLYSPILVNGSYLSDRIRSQKGDFILFYDETDIAKIPSFSVEEIAIEKSKVDNLKEELELIGISESTIYPSLSAETKKIKRNMLNTYMQKDFLRTGLEKSVNNFSNPKVDVNRMVEQKEVSVPRKYLQSKKMFVGLNPQKK